MDKIAFYVPDKIKLIGVWHYSSGSKKAVILAHGITADKDENGIFADLAETLKNNGFSVLRFDFRGHGESGGNSKDMTLKSELTDLKSAYHEVELREFSKIGLLGASFGGGIAALYAANNPSRLNSLCLWNPVLNYDHTFLNPELPWIRERKSHMTKEIETTGQTWLKSPNFILGKKLFDDMKIFRPYEELKKINIPTLIIHGDKDTKVPYEDSVQYVSNLKNGSFLTLKGAEHGFHKHPYNGKAIDSTVEFFTKTLL